MTDSFDWSTQSVALLILSIALAATATASGDDELQEVVVTAQRRAQNIQDVGVSVTALSGQNLQDLHITNTQALASQVPGLQVQSYSQAITVFNIRGVSQNDFGDQEEAPIAVYNDDAYNSYLSGAGSALFDVNRVEVLKGPQGTLFGRNATGGLINILSNRPTDTPEGYISASAGSFNDREGEGAISGPITEGMDGRLSLRGEKSDGYYQNTLGSSLGGTNEVSWRGQLLFKPVDGLSVLWNIRGTSDTSTGAGYTLTRSIFDPTGKIGNGLSYAPPTQAAYAAFCNQYFGTYTGGPGYSDCFGGGPTPSTPWTATENVRGYFHRNQYATTVHVDWQHDDLALTWITDYNRISKHYEDDTDATGLQLFTYLQDITSHQLSSELRLHWDEKTYRVTTGVYFLDISGSLGSGVNFTQLGADFYNPFTQSTRSAALFSQAEWDFAPQLTGIFGARYTKTKIAMNFHGTCRDVPATQFGLGCAGFGLPNDTLQSTGFDGSQESGDWSGKLELDWHAADQVLIYGSITRGNKAGGFNAPALGLGLTAAQTAFKPEVLTSYETGIKSTILDNRLRLNAAVFYYNYQNYQAFNLQNATQIVFNAQAKSHGGEIELQTAKHNGWEASLGFSFLDATTFDLLLPNGLKADQVMPLAARETVNAVLRKGWSVGDGELSIEGDVNYRTSIFFNSLNSPVVKDTPHATVNSGITYKSKSRWQVRVFATNLGNVAERTYCYDDTTVNGAAPCAYAPPREVHGSIRYDW